MPRAQVYGKRSRAVYNNFAIFDSPQRPTTLKPSGAEEKETSRLIEKITGLSLDAYARGVEDGRRRSVLGERNANSVVSLVVPDKKVKRARAKKIVEVEVIVAVGDVENDVGGNAARPEAYEDVGERVDVVADEVKQSPPATRLDDAEEAQTSAPDLTTADAAETDHETQQHEQDQLCADLMCFGVELQSVPQLEAVVPDIHTPAGVDIYSQHCSELLQLSSHRLTQFDDWADLLSNHFSLTKIAEASFGEVYRLSLLEQIPGLSASDESVFKVVALQPPPATLPTAKKQRATALKKAEAMSKPDDVANEVKLLQRMSSIPGFTNFRDVRILQGRPPPLFVDACKQYNIEQKAKRKETSHFPDPGKKASYSGDQLWAVIEMQDAGTDLERFVEMKECTSIWSVWDVFWQVVLSLAKGEEGAEFEHRDLHLGNICVRRRGPSVATSRTGQKAAIPVDVKKKLGFTDLETTIIDYTISRCLLSGTSKIGDIAYHDLALDPSLFQGDSTEEYQYDIYRYMRGAVYCSDPLATIHETGPSLPTASAAAAATKRNKPPPSWRKYHPITNLVWLHYLLHTLLEQIHWPSSSSGARKPPSKKLRSGLAHAEWKRAGDLEHKLLRVRSLLDPEVGFCRNGLRSASDVVGLAVGEGWLGVDDVVNAGVEYSEGTEGEDGEEKGDVGAVALPGGNAGLAEQLTDLVINVDVMEEHGLDVGEEEARSRSRRPGTRRKGGG
ncbi:hypothetical protein B0A55_08127 [Friedmanniomyces simplex]|uniref:non-specific serine/threonine protein kinase n=1 Tax=Friedmanniomyces simplex TaxID=329884 RepID=A0A4U0XC24_9PEZI|nr:hypothetical protein B0A55_08127 [Friedmanniomyces simplex]